jgi:transcriptional regulator with XRE-family HTH domain
MPEDPLCSVVAESFKRVLVYRRMSKTRAAKELRVSRQMFYEYLKGKSLPKREVLQRACDAWGLKINYRDLIVSSESFPSPSVKSDAPLATQLDLNLQEAIKQFGMSNEDLAVRILRKDNGRIELQVDLRFGSAS